MYPLAVNVENLFKIAFHLVTFVQAEDVSRFVIEPVGMLLF